MSVSTMARLAEGDSAEPDSTLQSAIRLVAAYVPAEAIATYIAVLGLLTPGSGASADQVQAIRLVCFVIGLAVSVGLAFVTFKGGNLPSASSSAASGSWPLWLPRDSRSTPRRCRRSSSRRRS